MVVLQRGDVVVAQSEVGLSVDLWDTSNIRTTVTMAQTDEGGRRRGHLVDVVVAGVVEVMTQSRGQHDQQVDSPKLVPEIRQPDEPVHLPGDKHQELRNKK